MEEKKPCCRDGYECKIFLEGGCAGIVTEQSEAAKQKEAFKEAIGEELENVALMDIARREAIESSRLHILKLEGELCASDYTRRMLESLLAKI